MLAYLSIFQEYFDLGERALEIGWQLWVLSPGCQRALARHTPHPTVQRCSVHRARLDSLRNGTPRVYLHDSIARDFGRTIAPSTNRLVSRSRPP